MYVDQSLNLYVFATLGVIGWIFIVDDNVEKCWIVLDHSTGDLEATFVF